MSNQDIAQRSAIPQLERYKEWHQLSDGFGGKQKT